MNPRCKARTKQTITYQEPSPAPTPRAQGMAMGHLTDQEVSLLLAAYRRGSRGEVLIGLHLLTRLLMMHLPVCPNEAQAIRQMEQAARILRRVGCDGWSHVRLVRLRRNAGPSTARSLAMVVDEFIEGTSSRIPHQRLLRLDGRGQWHLDGDERLEDGASLVLRRHFSVKE